MSVRVGVDVGGTFTKAVACDADSARVVARSVLPTTHDSPAGVAEGVGQAVAEIAREVNKRGLGPILLVAHSTTQAVNALLEGDTARVGVLGIGARPHLRRAAKRTRVGSIELAPGHRLSARHEFVDSANGNEAVEAALERLIEARCEAICVSQAFGVDDCAGERHAIEVAARRGVPACAGHELSGLYGLQMRTITAALNASILPAALRAARVVEQSVAANAPGAPLLVMRGDGGCSDLASMRRQPLVTAFSGPAASVAGTLRHVDLHEGVVIEVGGTSTNVSVVKGGRPALSYVRLRRHVTSVRSIDVRVAGVAGGSLARIAKRFGRARVIDVGPRSAHIAGLEYCSFATAERLGGARAVLISPRPGDPKDYLAIEAANGTRFALTTTCAANALGRVPSGSYCEAGGKAARAGFEAAARGLGCDWRALAEDMLDTASRRTAELVAEAIADYDLQRPDIAGVGGAAGALVPGVARMLGAGYELAPDAEVISSIGDALSLVRVEVERSLARPTPDLIGQLHREAEAAAVRAGAAPSTLHTESETIPDRKAVRIVARGSVSLRAGALPTDAASSDDELAEAARALVGETAEALLIGASYCVFAAANGRHGVDSSLRYAVLDRRGSLVAKGEGLVLRGRGDELSISLCDRIADMTKRLGPFSVAPSVRLVRATRLVDLSMFSSPERTLEAALAECGQSNGDKMVALIGHQ